MNRQRRASFAVRVYLRAMPIYPPIYTARLLISYLAACVVGRLSALLYIPLLGFVILPSPSRYTIYCLGFPLASALVFSDVKRGVTTSSFPAFALLTSKGRSLALQFYY